MQPEPLTREDVIRVLGDVDESVIADLISTDATQTQLLAAVEQLRNESFGWTSISPPDGRVIAVRDVLHRWWEATCAPEYLGTD